MWLPRRQCRHLRPLAALDLAGEGVAVAAPDAAAFVPGAIGRIAFHSNRDGDYEIYSMSPKGELGKRGQKAKQLTNNKVGDGHPAWSPGGKPRELIISW